MGCKAFACASRGCQATIHLHHDVEQRLRRTHETFYCPTGHSNYFPGKTDEEKEIEKLQREIDQITRVRNRFRELWEDACDDRNEWKLVAKTCPFECGYRVPRKSSPGSIQAMLAFHLIEEHGAVMPALEEAAL